VSRAVGPGASRRRKGGRGSRVTSKSENAREGEAGDRTGRERESRMVLLGDPSLLSLQRGVGLVDVELYYVGT
jgi:hypothetical protein